MNLPLVHRYIVGLSNDELIFYEKTTTTTTNRTKGPKKKGKKKNFIRRESNPGTKTP